MQRIYTSPAMPYRPSGLPDVTHHYWPGHYSTHRDKAPFGAPDWSVRCATGHYRSQRPFGHLDSSLHAEPVYAKTRPHKPPLPDSISCHLGALHDAMKRNAAPFEVRHIPCLARPKLNWTVPSTAFSKDTITIHSLSCRCVMLRYEMKRSFGHQDTT